jgi:4,5-DOPA dioxygenase extradiol
MVQPAIFIGHGNPMNALEENSCTLAWRQLGQTNPRPRAVLAISAHWFISGTQITANRFPATIHDFGGFPQELYEVQYPAPGDPNLTRRVQSMLKPLPVQMDESWGLDHGTWSVLRHMYPEADVPVIQLSIDAQKPASWHFDLGRRIAPLRSEDILVLGSGNLVHNLQKYSWQKKTEAPYDWAVRFEMQVREMMLSGEFEPLVDYEAMGTDAHLAVPTPDHYLPLLYILGCRQNDEPLSFPVEGFDGGSISMLGVRVG